MTKLVQLLLEFKSIPKVIKNQTFMEIAGFPHYENVCSNILAFYLNPNNNHGLSAIVLKSLIEAIDGDLDFDLKNVIVNREVRTGKDNRLDILVKTDKEIIGIENKIFHYLHNDLADYSDLIEFERSSVDQKIYKLVLSLKKLNNLDLIKLKDNGFINLTYPVFFEKLKNNLGHVIKPANIINVNYLTDFVKTIENLIQPVMENKDLSKFFITNSETIEELVAQFNGFKTEIYRKAFSLKDILPVEEFSPLAKKQWIYSGRCLVYDYTINNNAIAIDIYVGLAGWEIQLFARDYASRQFLFTEMCKKEGFLPMPFHSYKKDDRLLYAKFPLEEELQVVATCIADLLTRVEKYKKECEVVAHKVLEETMKLEA